MGNLEIYCACQQEITSLVREEREQSSEAEVVAVMTPSAEEEEEQAQGSTVMMSSEATMLQVQMESNDTAVATQVTCTVATDNLTVNPRLCLTLTSCFSDGDVRQWPPSRAYVFRRR